MAAPFLEVCVPCEPLSETVFGAALRSSELEMLAVLRTRGGRALLDSLQRNGVVGRPTFTGIADVPLPVPHDAALPALRLREEQSSRI